MKSKLLVLPPFVLALVMLLSGCQAIEGIFKAGVWTGIIVVVLILALVIFIVSKLFSKKS